jgi:hypothetical protein
MGGRPAAMARAAGRLVMISAWLVVTASSFSESSGAAVASPGMAAAAGS